MKVLTKGVTPHHCNPGWEARHYEPGPDDWLMPLPAGDYFHDLNLPAGSVVECDCGKVWVAHPMLPGEWPGLVMGRIHWRPEKRRERRRRMRVPRGG